MISCKALSFISGKFFLSYIFPCLIEFLFTLTAPVILIKRRGSSRDFFMMSHSQLLIYNMNNNLLFFLSRILAIEGIFQI